MTRQFPTTDLYQWRRNLKRPAPFPPEAIPPEGFATELADFKVGNPVETIHAGERYSVRQCFEWTGEKWEGFTSMTRIRRQS